MPIIRGGKSPVALRYVDAAGVEHQVVQVRLGEKIVWDGTTPAFVTMPRAVGSGFVRPALVSAGQSQEMPLSDHSAGEARPALVSAGANLVMPCATGVAGEAFAPSLFAGVEAEMSTAAGLGEVYPATAGEASPGDVYVLTAVGSGVVHPAVVSVPFERVMPHASGVGEVRPATVYGEAARELAVALGVGVANPAAVQHGQMQQMPRALGSGSASPAAASAAASAAMPRAVGTGQAYTALFQSGMEYSDDFNRANNTTTLGANWSPFVNYSSDYYGIASNLAYRDGTGNNTSDIADCALWAAPTLTSVQYSQVTIAALNSGNAPGAVVGGSGSSAVALFGTVGTTGWRIFTAVPGGGSSGTTLASGSGSYTAGSVLRLEKTSATTCRLLYGGVQLGSYTGALPSGLQVGIVCGRGTQRLNDWSGGDQ